MNPELNRQLIITADDCGLSEGINEAALELHQRGLLTTATVMMNFDAADHALRLFRDTQTLRVGVHLNLTDGFPVTDVDSTQGLVGSDGRFQPRTLLFPRAVFPLTNWLDAARAEMVGQIEAFQQVTGFKPDHLTTHMHFHILPSLRQLVIELANQYDISWVRAFETSSTVIPYNFFMQEPSQLFHPDNLKITPDYIASLQAWMGLEPDRLFQTMLGLNGLIEIVVHPDHETDATYPESMSHRPEERAREMAYLLRLGELIEAHDEAFMISDPSRETAKG